jgi:hypothetical protein
VRGLVFFLIHHSSHATDFVGNQRFHTVEAPILSCGSGYGIYGGHSSISVTFFLVLLIPTSPTNYYTFNQPYLCVIDWRCNRSICSPKPKNFTLFHSLHDNIVTWLCNAGAHVSINGWGTMLQVGRSWVRVHMRSLIFFFLFSLPNPSSHTMALRFTQPLTEMSTRNLPGEGWQPNLHLWADCLDNVESSTSHNLIGLHGLLQG